MYRKNKFSQAAILLAKIVIVQHGGELCIAYIEKFCRMLRKKNRTFYFILISFASQFFEINVCINYQSKSSERELHYMPRGL